MKRFAILGYPLGHAISPPIHERLFVLGKQQAEYEVLQTPPEQFEALWPYLRQLDGFNITIPYKQQIIPFCARLDDTAKRYGAVNVVDGRMAVPAIILTVWAFCVRWRVFPCKERC